MYKTVLAAVIVLGATTTFAFAASQEDCTAMWKKINPKGDATVTGDMIKPYVSAVQAAKMPLKDINSMTDKEFTDACLKDTFKDVK